MAEKKMTKAEQKRMELATRHTFIVDAFDIFMKTYPKVLGDSRNSSKMTITVNNYNHYIRFSAHCQGFAICIYTSGDIDVHMKEFCHGEYTERIFEYSPDKNVQAKFLDYLEETLAPIILEVALEEVAPYHYFMDLLYGENHFLEAYDFFKKENEKLAQEEE